MANSRLTPTVVKFHQPHDKDLLLEGSEKMSKVKIKHNQSTKMSKNSGSNNFYFINFLILFLFMNYKTYNTAYFIFSLALS